MRPSTTLVQALLIAVPYVLAYCWTSKDKPEVDPYRPQVRDGIMKFCMDRTLAPRIYKEDITEKACVNMGDESKMQLYINNSLYYKSDLWLREWTCVEKLWHVANCTWGGHHFEWFRTWLADRGHPHPREPWPIEWHFYAVPMRGQCAPEDISSPK
ncbi:hypothetical protein F66182_5420 [Fusarium sp. NRRL 66182]|nr:hypothetical protein F66182_5420 [Fusarium sp. NRRL 66182]